MVCDEFCFLSCSSVQNPFGEDDWEEYENTALQDDVDGVPVRAVYSYDGQEGDELSFKAGTSNYSNHHT